MTDLQAAKRTINMLADALWSAQSWETAEQIRRRVLAGLNEDQIVAVEKQIYINREKQAAFNADASASLATDTAAEASENATN